MVFLRFQIIVSYYTCLLVRRYDFSSMEDVVDPSSVRPTADIILVPQVGKDIFSVKYDLGC